MTESEKRVRDRQAGEYTPPILTEPRGGPISAWRAPETPGAETVAGQSRNGSTNVRRNHD